MHLFDHHQLTALILSISMLISVILCADFSENSLSDVAAFCEYGCEGRDVEEIQSRLKAWGYYTGNVDGIFGLQTQEAVKWFQQNNDLTCDGICGPMTLFAIGIPDSDSYGDYTESDLDLLARVISAEARGEPYNGQVAVGAVILNRVKHPSFPDSISGVCYQLGAFTSVRNGQVNAAPTDSSIDAAMDALNGWDPSGGAIYFYNPDNLSDDWILSRPIIKTIGNHRFCG